MPIINVRARVTITNLNIRGRVTRANWNVRARVTRTNLNVRGRVTRANLNVRARVTSANLNVRARVARASLRHCSSGLFPLRSEERRPLYRVIHKSVKRLKNSQQIHYSTDHGSSYADRERERERETRQVFFYIFDRCSMCPPLVIRQTSMR